MSVLSPEAVAKSQAHYWNPENYSPLTVANGNRYFIGCIEPRDPAYIPHGKYSVFIQEAGGGPGSAVGTAVHETAKTSELVTVEEAQERNRQIFRYMVFGSHQGDCAFVLSIAPILSEMEKPNDLTVETYKRWAQFFNEEDNIKRGMAKTTSAAGKVLEAVLQHDDMTHLIQRTSDQFPDHSNVMDVDGEKGAKVYVDILQPLVGQDRNKKPTNPDERRQVRAYVTTLGATVTHLANSYQLSPQDRGSRLRALLLREAATRTVIAGGNPELMTFLQVVGADTPTGLAVNAWEI